MSEASASESLVRRATRSPLPAKEDGGAPDVVTANGAAADADDEGYDLASFRAFLAREDSALTWMASSIANLKSAPARIAWRCQDELLRGVDEDEGVDVVGLAGASERSVVRMMEHGGLSPVRRQLALNGTPSPGSGPGVAAKRTAPLVAGEGPAHQSQRARRTEAASLSADGGAWTTT